MSDEKFGFYIDIKTEGGRFEKIDGENKFIDGKPTGKYEVALPHSCDQWSIVWGTKEECINGLQSFIDEATEILKELNSKPDTIPHQGNTEK